MSKAHKSQQKRSNQAMVTIPKTPYTATTRQSPIATRLVTVLRYTEVFSAAGLPFTDYKFNLNGLYDPNLTAGGHQPKGFDQLAALYQRYRVYRCAYEVRLVSGSTAQGLLVVVPTNSTSGYTTGTDGPEAYLSKQKEFNLYNTAVIKGVVDLPVLNGKSRVAYAADDSTQALTSANPTENLILHVIPWHMDGSTNLSAYVSVTLSFTAEFSDVVELSQS